MKIDEIWVQVCAWGAVGGSFLAAGGSRRVGRLAAGGSRLQREASSFAGRIACLVELSFHCQFGSRHMRSGRVYSIPYCIIWPWCYLRAPVVGNRKTERLMRMVKTKSMAPQMRMVKTKSMAPPQKSERASDVVIATAAPRGIQEYR